MYYKGGSIRNPELMNHLIQTIPRLYDPAQQKVADYDMKIPYKPGKENIVADALSHVQINMLCLSVFCWIFQDI